MSATARPSRARRLLRGALLTLIGLVLVAVLGVSWHFADQLTLPATVRPFVPDNAITSVVTDTSGELVIGLRDEGFAAQGERWGLQLAEGRHLRLVERLDSDGEEVRWRAEDPDRADPQVGEDVRVDEYAYAGDPSDIRLTFVEPDLFPGEDLDGLLPTWFVPAEGTAAGTVVYVHGRGATREEALRFLPAMHAAGWDVYVQSYRGDAGAPSLPDDRLRYGATEWADVEGSIYRASSHADRGPVVLFGASMGGSLIAQTLDRSEVADEVDAVILDSPLLSMDDLLDLQAGLNGIPAWAAPVVLPLVQLIADLRFGLDSSSLEQDEADATFDRPVLLFHGDADGFVPFDASKRLAEASDSVTWVRVPEAGHVRSWNLDPDAYEAALTAFLDQVASS